MILAAPARAADASAWDEDSHSALRLIAGANKAARASLRAGIEIKLQPGWKTYWRYPGDSGVPPRFDFSGSENLETRQRCSIRRRICSPTRPATRIGYKDDVIFPLQRDAARSRQAGHAASQARLRGLREAVRAGRRQAPS